MRWSGFVNHSYDNRKNWTPLSPITITIISVIPFSDRFQVLLVAYKTPGRAIGLTSVSCQSSQCLHFANIILKNYFTFTCIFKKKYYKLNEVNNRFAWLTVYGYPTHSLFKILEWHNSNASLREIKQLLSHQCILVTFYWVFCCTFYYLNFFFFYLYL